jgi:periplasmic divalent cation tolerance protein
MTDKLIVFTTCGAREDAEKIAKAVVMEKLAACVNVLPGVRSCYEWEGKMEWSEELLLMMKTTRDRYEELEARIRELHAYEVPEILAVPVAAGLEKYLEWVDSNTRK